MGTKLDILGKKYTFDTGYIYFTSTNTLETLWGAGNYDILDSQRITAYWNNHYHTLTFNSDCTYFISKRIKPADSQYIQGTIYYDLTRNISTPWICAELAGGIGNRMYQLAAALGLGERTGRPVVFCHRMNTGWTHQNTAHMYYLFPHIPILHDSVPNVSFDHQLKDRKPYDYYEISALSENCMLAGNWQNMTYFPSYPIDPSFDMFLTADLRTHLLQKYKVENIAQKLSTWFVHVRLGDYKKYNELNHITVESYHRQLIKDIPEGANILLFSNELEVAANLLHEGRAIVCCDEQNECISLFLMQQCWGGAIVPNSTFSWWGSYFSYMATPFKHLYKAYYPKVWFRDDEESGKAYTPPWAMR